MGKKLVRRRQRKTCKGGLTTKIENEEKLPNENGRFPCKNCNLTFKHRSHARRHERKYCNSEFEDQDQIEFLRSNDIKQETYDQNWDLNEDQKDYETLDEIKIENQDSTWYLTEDQTENHFVKEEQDFQDPLAI